MLFLSIDPHWITVHESLLQFLHSSMSLWPQKDKEFSSCNLHPSLSELISTFIERVLIKFIFSFFTKIYIECKHNELVNEISEFLEIWYTK